MTSATGTRLLRRTHRDAEPGQTRGEGPALQQLPHHRAVLALPRGLAHRPQPPRHRPGGHNRGRHRVPGQLRLDPQKRGDPCRDSQAERLQHLCHRQVAPGPVHRLHRSRSVRPLAAGNGVREVLRLPRRRDRPVGAAPGSGQHLHRDPRAAGLPFDGRPGGPDHRLHPRSAAGQHRAAVLRLPRDRGDHAPLHAPKECIDKYKGKFDQGWDKVREETFERQKKLGIIPQRCEADPARSDDQGLDRSERHPEEGVQPAPGDLCRDARPRRPPPRPAVRSPRRTGHPRQHPHHGRLRQRGLPGGTPGRRDQHRPLPQLQPRNRRGDGQAPRPDRQPRDRPTLPHGLVTGRQHAFQEVETGHAPGRQHRSVHRLLARQDQGRGRNPQAVPPPRGCRPDHSRVGRTAGPHVRERRPPDAAARGEHGLHLCRRRRPRPARRCSTTRCSAAGPSGPTAGPQWRGTRRARPGRRTSGNSTTRTRTSPQANDLAARTGEAQGDDCPLGGRSQEIQCAAAGRPAL